MRFLRAVLLLPLLSCGEGVAPALATPGADPVVVLAPPSLEERLSGEDVPLLHVLPHDTYGSVDVRRVLLDRDYTTLPVRAAGGELRVRMVRDRIVHVRLERFSVKLADVPVLDTGMTLTHLELRLEAGDVPEVGWLAEGTQAYVPLEGTMTLRGWLHGPSGAESPFEPQTFEAVPAELWLSLDAAEGVTARFHLWSENLPTWQWLGLLETGAASLEARAVESPRPPQRR